MQMHIDTTTTSTIRPHVKRELLMSLAEKATLKKQLQLSFRDLETIADELQKEVARRVQLEKELATYRALFGEIEQLLSV